MPKFLFSYILSERGCILTNKQKKKNQQTTHQDRKIEDLIIVNEEKKGRINQKKFYAL